MEFFKIMMGKTKIEFSVIFNKEKQTYQGLINHMVLYESTDYESVRMSIMEGLESNHVYNGMIH